MSWAKTNRCPLPWQVESEGPWCYAERPIGGDLESFVADDVFLIVYSILLGIYLVLKFQMRLADDEGFHLSSGADAPLPPPLPPPLPAPLSSPAMADRPHLAPISDAPEPRKSIATLMRVAATGENRAVRVSAIRALGRLKARESLSVLGEALASPEAEVAAEAANALGQIGDPRAVDLLVRNSQRVAEELQRLTPLPGRSSFAGPAHSAPAPHGGNARLEPMLPSGTWVQAEAQGMAPLAKICDPLAQRNFRVLDKYTPYDLRKLSEDEIAELLVRMACNRAESTSNRYFALKNLSAFRPPNLDEHLVLLLRDEDPTLRYASAELLGIHGSDESIPDLIEALDDENAYVRSSAALSLAALNADRAIRPLMRLRFDSDEVVRYSVKKALEEIGRRKGLSSELLCSGS